MTYANDFQNINSTALTNSIIERLIMRPAILALIAALRVTCCHAHAFDFDHLSDRQVEVLLENQARHQWGEDLLQVFPASQERDTGLSVLPITAFPALLSTEAGAVPKQFSEWCEQHLLAAKAQLRYGTALSSLCTNQDLDSLQTLVSQINHCVSSEEMPPVLRLASLGILVNHDAEPVIESMLLFCLHYTNEIELLKTRQLNHAGYSKTSTDAEHGLSNLTRRMLAVLETISQSQVMAEYILLAIDGVGHIGSPLALNRVGRSDFSPPFLLQHGDPSRIFHVSIDESILANSGNVGAARVVVSERVVLNSYRQELLNNSNFIAATVARHELFIFVDKLVSRVMAEGRTDHRADADYQAGIDLLLSRFLQIDDASIMFLLAPLLQDEVNAIAERGSEEIGHRYELAHALLAVLQSYSVEPKHHFGVSVVDIYDNMSRMRQVSKSVESLLAVNE